MPPRTSSRSGSDGRKRYAATVEKGDNAWKREWNSFISGVDMKRVRDGTTSVALKARTDLAHGADLSDDDKNKRGSDPRRTPHTSRVASARQSRQGDGEYEDDQSAPSFSAAPASFAYLFGSPAEKRAERNEKKKREEEERRKKQEKGVSKHRLAIDEAQKRGLNVAGMSRKQVRDFLHLTRSSEQAAAQQHSRELKLHDLMDERIAWYQQGPHPIDLIAERLVARKAAKKGKRLGLVKYNYLLPHPSWMAARTRRRVEGVLVGLGKRFIFDEETGQAMDPLHNNAPVDVTKVNLLLHGGGGGGRGALSASSRLAYDADARGKEHEDVMEAEDAELAAANWREDDGGDANRSADLDDEHGDSGDDENVEDSGDHGPTGKQQQPRGQTVAVTAVASTPVFVDSRTLDSLLIDPTRALTTFSRAVVKDREAAMVIKRANLTTHYLSQSLVQSPNIGLDNADADGEEGNDEEAAVRRQGGQLAASGHGGRRQRGSDEDARARARWEKKVKKSAAASRGSFETRVEDENSSGSRAPDDRHSPQAPAFSVSSSPKESLRSQLNARKRKLQQPLPARRKRKE